MHFHSNAALAGIVMLFVHVGYEVGSSFFPLAGAQLPNAGMLPTTYTLWPQNVVPFSQAKVTVAVDRTTF